MLLFNFFEIDKMLTELLFFLHWKVTVGLPSPNTYFINVLYFKIMGFHSGSVVKNPHAMK